MRGRGHGESERRLQVGLLEHREHAARVGDLELGVEVGLVVDGVDEPVQAFAGVHVAAVGDDREFVLGGEVRQLDADSVAHLGRVERDAVQCDGVHLRRDRVDEGGGAFGCGEPHGGLAAEHLRPRGHVEHDVVVVHRHERSTLFGFEPREVLSWQLDLPFQWVPAALVAPSHD